MKSIRSFRFVLLLTFIAGIAGAQSDMSEKVIIRTAKPYDKVVSAIKARGGIVTNQYRYVAAIAATIPLDAIGTIRSMPEVVSIGKDQEIPLPRSVDVTTPRNFGTAAPERAAVYSTQPLSTQGIARLAATPAGYTLNSMLMGMEPLWQASLLGQGQIVAVVDTGIRPDFPHIKDTVVGGEDFVGDGLGYENTANNGHGTFVTGMIAAHAQFVFWDNAPFTRAVKAYAPAAAEPYPDIPGTTLIPMMGTAPAAKVYALRVLGPSGTGLMSRTMRALERVIELRELYDAGKAGGLNIGVCNISIGGSRVAPGIDAEDELIDQMLERDIIPVLSAGNAGPAALTISGPGTSNSALTVGAASLAHNERILRDLQYGSGIGAQYRPFDSPIMAYFSSRGPNANGRIQPSVVANGFASYGMGFGSADSLEFGHGTSFAAPSVSGIAAVLRQAFPEATARQIRNAIIVSANPTLVAGATNLDQGSGFVNAAAAREILAAGKAPDTLSRPPLAVSSVRVNVERNTALDVQDGLVTQALPDLRPGERRDVVIDVKPNTRSLDISIWGFAAAPPEQQNVLFGDQLLLGIHSAKTSAIGEAGDYKVFGYIRNGTLRLDRPETGLMRISVSGYWTNAKPVSANVSVTAETDPIPQLTVESRILPSQRFIARFTVPPGTRRAEAQLGWRKDWGTFPTADLELVLRSPTGKFNYSGVTHNNPEIATIDNPEAGVWQALIVGFAIPDGSDNFQLRIALDGVVIH